MNIFSGLIRFQTIAIILFIGGCQKGEDPVPAMTVIISGEWKNFNWTQNDLVITNQSDWTAFIGQVNPLLSISGNPLINEMAIDFSTYQVVAVFDAIKGSAGYSVEVTDVIEDNVNTRVFVLHDGPLNATTEEVTQAFTVVTIPKPNKPVVFEHKAVPPRIYPHSIGQGALKSNPTIFREDVVVTTQDDWEALLIKMNVESSVDFLTYYPPIDFTKFMVIAAFEKRECSYPCSSSVSTDITDIIETENGITVKVQNL